MRVRLQRAATLLLAALALIMLQAGAAFAVASVAPAPLSDFAAAVPDLPGKTWLDLLRQLFPDVATAPTSGIAATATKMTPLRSIGVADDDWVQCGDQIEFRSLDARPVRLTSRRYRIVTLAVPDDCTAPLALFDDTGKLVDAVNVKGDQHVSFSGDYVRELAPSGALIIASNWHDNTSRSYDRTMLILARAEGLSSIGDVLALGSRECAEGTSVEEEAAVRVVPDDAPFARIEVAVTRRVQKLAADCKTGPGRPVAATFTGSWRWNARKSAYEPRTKELDRLGGWNQKHF